jgi:hypothetical protein
MKKGEIDTRMNTPIGKTPTGAQNQGDNIDVTIYAKVNTGKGGKTNIDTLMDCPLGKVPTGEKTGGL